jgi:hypothetical protein
MKRKHWYNLRRAYRVLSQEPDDPPFRSRWERRHELEQVVGGTLLGYQHELRPVSRWYDPRFYQIEGYNYTYGTPLSGDALKDMLAERRDYRWHAVRQLMYYNVRAR